MGRRHAHPSPKIAPHRTLGQRHRQPPAGDVLGRGHQCPGDGLADERLECRLSHEVKRWWIVLGRGTGEGGVGGPGKTGLCVTDQDDLIVNGHERRPDEGRDVLQQADDPDHGRGGDRAGR